MFSVFCFGHLVEPLCASVTLDLNSTPSSEGCPGVTSVYPGITLRVFAKADEDESLGPLPPPLSSRDQPETVALTDKCRPQPYIHSLLIGTDKKGFQPLLRPWQLLGDNPLSAAFNKLLVLAKVPPGPALC